MSHLLPRSPGSRFLLESVLADAPTPQTASDPWHLRFPPGFGLPSKLAVPMRG